MRTIALAYSGGLDTSIIVPWLREHYDAKVICVAADIGQGEELDGVKQKAIDSGAAECHVEDLRAEYVRDFIWPTLRAGAIYYRKYLLGTAMARPLIAKKFWYETWLALEKAHGDLPQFIRQPGGRTK